MISTRAAAGAALVWLLCSLDGRAAQQNPPTAAPPAPTGASPSAASADLAAAKTDDAATFRVFLRDGTSLVSYGEPARLDDRVVFSMPTSANRVEPQLHLVTLPAERVDWERTNRYADSARATRYISTRA